LYNQLETIKADLAKKTPAPPPPPPSAPAASAVLQPAQEIKLNILVTCNSEHKVKSTQSETRSEEKQVEVNQVDEKNICKTWTTNEIQNELPAETFELIKPNDRSQSDNQSKTTEPAQEEAKNDENQVEVSKVDETSNSDFICKTWKTNESLKELPVRTFELIRSDEEPQPDTESKTESTQEEAKAEEKQVETSEPETKNEQTVHEIPITLQVGPDQKDIDITVKLDCHGHSKPIVNLPASPVLNTPICFAPAPPPPPPQPPQLVNHNPMSGYNMAVKPAPVPSPFFSNPTRVEPPKKPEINVDELIKSAGALQSQVKQRTASLKVENSLKALEAQRKRLSDAYSTIYSDCHKPVSCCHKIELDKCKCHEIRRTVCDCRVPSKCCSVVQIEHHVSPVRSSASSLLSARKHAHERRSRHCSRSSSRSRSRSKSGPRVDCWNPKPCSYDHHFY
jgi:hypothetical protein